MPSREPGLDFWGSLERRIHVEWVLVTFLMLLLTIGLSHFGAAVGLTRVDNSLYDRIMTTMARSIDAHDIVIVAVDDSSIADIGYWPWRRAVHARLLDRLGNARVVGFDMMLSDQNPAYPDDDDVLARAIARNGKVVLATMVERHSNYVVSPLSELARAAAAQGYINVYPDSDGVVRSLTLRQRLSTGVVAEHFLTAVLAVAGTPLQTTAADTGVAQFIYYGGGANRFTIYPYVRVLDGSIPASAFEGKYVLVGSWASGLGASFSTPISSEDGAMPGVEVLANGLQSAINNAWVRTLDPWLATLYACLPVLLVCLLFRRLSPRRSFIVVLAGLMLAIVSTGLLLRFAGIWLPISASLIGVALSFPVWSWRSQEASLQHIDRELGALNQDRADLGDDTSAFVSSRKDASLPARVSQLHGAIAQLRDARIRREQTLRFLSHDMRAPQNSILALTQLQQQPDTAMEWEPFLQHIDSYAYKTLALTDGFVHLARAQAMQIEPKPVELVDLIEQSLEEFWAQARQRNIELRFEHHPDHAWVQGDASLLLRAFSNLVDNALKYSPDHTYIECTLQADGEYWRASVRDQGQGFTSTQAATLFHAFTRLDEPRNGSPSGVGLGLAFVRTVVERVGGHVHVISEEGRGAEFVLYLSAQARSGGQMLV